MKKLTIDNVEYFYKQLTALENDLSCGITARFHLYHPKNPLIVISGLVKYVTGGFGMFEGTNGGIKTILTDNQVKFYDSKKGGWRVGVTTIGIPDTESNPLATITVASPSQEYAEQITNFIALAPMMLNALKSTFSLNLHQYEEGTVGNRVYNEIKQAIKLSDIALGKQDTNSTPIVSVTKIKTIDIDNDSLLVKICFGSETFETNIQYNRRTNTAHFNDDKFELLMDEKGIKMDEITDGIESRKYQIN